MEPRRRGSGLSDASSAAFRRRAGDTTFTYDAGGRKTLQVNPNALRDTFSFNPDDTLASRVTTNNSNPPTAANTVASWSYAYDADYRQLQ